MDDSTNVPEQTDQAAAPAEDNQLDQVKHKALEALVPIMDHLSGMDAERKFDLCLTAMRYTDNKGLANTAFEAALAIEENGTKAEALVELINEINYLQQA